MESEEFSEAEKVPNQATGLQADLRDQAMALDLRDLPTASQDPPNPDPATTDPTILGPDLPATTTPDPRGLDPDL